MIKGNSQLSLSLDNKGNFGITIFKGDSLVFLYDEAAVKYLETLWGKSFKEYQFFAFDFQRISQKLQFYHLPSQILSELKKKVLDPVTLAKKFTDLTLPNDLIAYLKALNLYDGEKIDLTNQGILTKLLVMKILQD